MGCGNKAGKIAQLKINIDREKKSSPHDIFLTPIVGAATPDLLQQKSP
jgi:hypothetical protein